MTDTALLYLICGLLLLALAVLVALLLRRPDAAQERLRGQLEEALRAEQRDGRLELRQQRQPGKTAAEVVNRHADPRSL